MVKVTGLHFRVVGLVAIGRVPSTALMLQTYHKHVQPMVVERVSNST